MILIEKSVKIIIYRECFFHKSKNLKQPISLIIEGYIHFVVLLFKLKINPFSERDFILINYLLKSC